MRDNEKDEEYEAERVPDASAPFELTPKKIALAAVDWTVPREKGPRARTYYDHGFDPFLADVAGTAEAEGCDTVAYALWSHDLRKMVPLDEARVFGSTTKIQTAVLEELGISGPRSLLGSNAAHSCRVSAGRCPVTGHSGQWLFEHAIRLTLRAPSPSSRA